MSDLLNAINDLTAQGEALLGGMDLEKLLGLSGTRSDSPVGAFSAISAIIPSRNEGAKVARTVRSLVHGRSCAFPLEVVVVDDASTDRSCDRLSEIAGESPNVSVVVRRLEQWSGIPFSRNRGAEISHHPIYLITDANTTYPKNWDASIRQHFHPGRIMTGTIVDEETGYRGYGLSLELPLMGVKWITDPRRYGGYTPVAACTCTIVDRQLFHGLGGYDETLPLYGAAEPEFSVRAWLSGYEIVNLPEMLVLHRFRSYDRRSDFLNNNQNVLLKNYVRFACSYLPDEALKESLARFAQQMGSEFDPCLRDLERQGIWNRREQLRKVLHRDFSWLSHRFGLNASSHPVQVNQLSQPRTVVYTAVLGDYDVLEPAFADDVEHICFTDQRNLKAKGWRVIQVKDLPPKMTVDERVRLARRLKLLPHEYLPGYQIWIWRDANLQLRRKPSDLAAHFLEGVDVATFQHPKRNCIYDEAKGCANAGKDSPGKIYGQVGRYQAEGYPTNNGLIWSALLIRRNTSQIRALNEAWWAELSAGSRRDQLSFNYVAWKLGLPYARIPEDTVAVNRHKEQIYHAPAFLNGRELTILLLNWRRPHNLQQILASIDRQSKKPNVFLWNNGERVVDPRVDWYVESSKNRLCWPRWAIGAMADTEFVCSLDDDFAFADDRVIEDLLNYLKRLEQPDRLVGAEGVILDPGKPYHRCGHVQSASNRDIPVDIIKGKLLACRRDTLRSMAMVAETREDDIAVSGLAAQGRPLHHRVPSLFHNRMFCLPEYGVGLSHAGEHNGSREGARRKYFAR